MEIKDTNKYEFSLSQEEKDKITDVISILYQIYETMDNNNYNYLRSHWADYPTDFTPIGIKNIAVNLTYIRDAWEIGRDKSIKETEEEMI